MIDELRDALNELRTKLTRRRRWGFLITALCVCSVGVLGAVNDLTDPGWARVLILPTCFAAGCIASIAMNRIAAAENAIRHIDDALAATDALPPTLNAFTFAQYARHANMHNDTHEQETPQ